MDAVEFGEEMGEAIDDLPTYDEVVEMYESEGSGPEVARQRAEANEIMRKLGEINLYVGTSEYLDQDTKVAVLTGTLEIMLRLSLPVLMEEGVNVDRLVDALDGEEGA